MGALSETERATFACMLLDRRVKDDNRDQVYECMRKNFANDAYTVEQVRNIIEQDIEPFLQEIKSDGQRTLEFLMKGGRIFKYAQALGEVFGEHDVKVLPGRQTATTTKGHGNGNGSTANAASRRAYQVSQAGESDSEGNDDDIVIVDADDNEKKRPVQSTDSEPAAKRQKKDFGPPPQLDEDYGDRTIAKVKAQLMKKLSNILKNQKFEPSQIIHVAAIASCADYQLSCQWIESFCLEGITLSDNRYFYKDDDDLLQQHGVDHPELVEKYGREALKARKEFLDNMSRLE